MRFHYGGKYTDESQLVRKPDPEGSVMFKEPEDMNKMSLRMNALALGIAAVLLLVFFLINRNFHISFLGTIILLLHIVPHEILHALCFKEDVTIYTNLSRFLLFVYGTEDMSKTRFILMSLCPNIVFGFIPMILYFIFPDSNTLGTVAAFCLSSGAGDYLNVFHALTEVPNGAKIYMNGIHTYWYKE
jgi:hypothetical protein